MDAITVDKLARALFEDERSEDSYDPDDETPMDWENRNIQAFYTDWAQRLFDFAAKLERKDS